MRARVNANGVRLYEHNSTISPAKGFLANGEEIEIKAEYGDWCQLMDGRWVEACYTEAIDVSGGGGGGVSSWNDLTDRPFYEGEIAETVILDKITVVVAEDGNGAAGKLGDLTLEEGLTYNVTIGGETRECIAWVHDIIKLVCIGNGSYLFAPEKGNGEPFLITGSDVNGNEAALITNEGTYEVSLSYLAREIKEIETKYLPRATEEQRGIVRYGIGYDKAARVIDTFLGATYDDFNKAYEAFMRGGVVWRIVDEIVLSASGTLEGELGVWLTIDRGGQENVVHVIGNQEDGTTYMERLTRTVSEDRIPPMSKMILKSTTSGSNKQFEITVNDSGTISATEVTA